MTDAELFAQSDDRVESFHAEIHAAVDIAQVGQLDAQRFVHRSKMEQRIRLNAVLIERRARPGQPAVARRPPQSVIRPIERYICKWGKKTNVKHVNQYRFLHWHLDNVGVSKASETGLSL